MDISVRDLCNDIIKPSENGLESVFDSVKYKFLLSDTILRSFIPPQVLKMTPQICQIGGCDICIIIKGTHIDLKGYRKKLVADLQQKSFGRHTRNSVFSNTSAAHYN